MARWIAFAVFLLSVPVAAQYMDYGTSVPKLGKESHDAGIGSYHLERAEDGTYHAEVLKPGGAALTECDIDFSDRSPLEITCIFEDQPYKATYRGESATFEELTTGEHINVSFEGSRDEARIVRPSPTDPELTDLEPIVTGTKTLEEATDAWDPQMTILRLVFAEVLATLNGTPTRFVGAPASSRRGGDVREVAGDLRRAGQPRGPGYLVRQPRHRL